MMKKLKYLTSLLALTVIGTGFLSDAEAAVIDAVEIIEPDSGAVRGIDSLVCVRVTATFTDDPATSTAYVWLHVGDDVTAVLAEAANVAGTVTNQIRTADAAQTTAAGIPAGDFVAGSLNLADPNVVAEDVSEGTSTINGTTIRTVVYNAKVKVPPTAGTVEGVRASAVIFDESRNSGEEWTTFGTSAASKTIRIDGDRPSQTGFAGFSGANAVKAVDGHAVKVTGLTTGKAEVDVLGIGDQLEISFDLGNRADDVLVGPFANRLRLVARFLSKTIELPVTSKDGTFTYTVAEGDFPDLASQGALSEFVFSLFLIDPAGNLSDNDPDNATPEGVTQAVCLLIDATKPGVDTAEGDTLSIADGDTLTCGMKNDYADCYANVADAPDWLTRQDLNSLVYEFAEGLDKLKIDFAGPKAISVTIDPDGKSFTQGAGAGFELNVFAKDVRRSIDITNLAKALSDPPSAATDDLDLCFVEHDDVAKDGSPDIHTLNDVHATSGETQVTVAGDNGKDGLMDGIYSITFTPWDLAGNQGAGKTVNNICVDVTKPSFGSRLFPIGSALETINKDTAKIRLQFNEPMAHAEIVYIPVDAASNPIAGGTTRRRVLTGSELTSTEEQVVTVDSLEDDTQYRVFIVAQDLKGKIQRSTVDEFLYDEQFVNAVADRFDVTTDFSTDPATTVPAGTAIKVTITAVDGTADDGTANDPVVGAVTFDEDKVVVTIAGDIGGGLKLVADKNPGVTDLGDGTYELDQDGWANGTRDLNFIDETANDELTITVANAEGNLTGFVKDADGAQRVFKIVPGAYAKLVFVVPESAVQGEAFWVDVFAADSFGNTRLGDSRFVVISSNKIGVIGPSGGEIMLSEGKGGFWAKSPMWHGEGLYFKGRDVLPFENQGGDPVVVVVGASGDNSLSPSDVGKHFIWGQSATMIILAADGSGAALTSVAEVIPLDFLGAKGLGDQGGFVVVHFPVTPEHDWLDSYTIWREVVTTVVLGDDGALQVLDPADAVSVFIPWAVVEAHAGVDLMRVVVATLDSDASRYAVTANGHGTSSVFNDDEEEAPAEEEGEEEGEEEVVVKRAFADAASIASPYELMAQTMVNSKEAATLQDVPVFATLTPEALAFMDQGVVPNLKEVGTAFESARTVSAEAVRAIDNIAPEAVASLRAVDTPNDAGSSITVNWVKSESDAPISMTVGNAVGASGNTFNTKGVMGYNIYRAIGNEGEFQLVGKANAGETSFEDITALNGVRYSYKVVPYDNDNEALTDLTGSAMAIRNRVIDRNGQVVVGLFGADNKVGFDDFFMFADHFGLRAGEANFETAFDLNQDNQINFTDFFTFADNFGRSVDLAGKAVPTLAGLNSDARLDVATGDALPRVGEDMVVRVNLADFMEVKGYGFDMSYDPNELEFVKVATMDNNILGAAELAQPQVIAHEDGKLSIGAFGDVATEGQLEVNLVFRAKTEIEDGYIELSDGELRDANYGLNQVASLGFVRIETRPEAFALGNNFPNPFNPETTIKYALPEAGSTKLVIYNVVGQVVRHLVAEHQSAGRYVIQWDATNDNGHSLSSGVYFYHLQVGGEFQQVKRMLLLK